MQIFERFRRRWLERFGPWTLTLVFVYFLAIVLLVVYSLRIHYQETQRQERLQSYLLDVNAFKLQIEEVSDRFYQEMEAINKLDHRVEFIQNQKDTLHRGKL